MYPQCSNQTGQYFKKMLPVDDNELFIELQQVELLKNTLQTDMHVSVKQFVFKIKVKLYEKTCEVYVIKQLRLLGLRAACVFCHSG